MYDRNKYMIVDYRALKKGDLYLTKTTNDVGVAEKDYPNLKRDIVEPVHNSKAWERLMAAIDSVHDEPEKDDLRTWWVDLAGSDFDATVGKIQEYGGQSGSADIDLMSHAFKVLRPDLDDQICQELAINFYQLGKVARQLASYTHNRKPSEDTLLDNTVYSMMLRRIREKGSWG